jgi:hypothetical protein
MVDTAIPAIQTLFLFPPSGMYMIHSILIWILDFFFYRLDMGWCLCALVFFSSFSALNLIYALYHFFVYILAVQFVHEFYTLLLWSIVTTTVGNLD